MIGVAIAQPETDEAPGNSLAPFGAGVKLLARREAKPADAKSLAIDCLGAANASQWTVENPPEGQAANPFGLEERDGKRSLTLSTGGLVPARSTVRILLPGDGPANGDVWARNRATYVSFLCSSDKPARMTFHLLQRGKSAGTFQTGFTARPGQWQRVVLPLGEFKLRTFARVAGIGFRVAESQEDAKVSISEISVGSMPYSDDSWKSHRLAISLKGDWRFATDPGDQGMKEKWHAPGFDDSSWKILQAGLPWQAQGIAHHGFGWYRQKILIPKELAGTPLRLTLTSIPSDDDAWFNGVRVGGWSGEYKYTDRLLRVYTVPPSLIRYGQTNTIVLRIWGGNLSFLGDKSGLTAGPLVAELDPYCVKMRPPGGEEVPCELFDLSDARQGKPFEIVFPFPAEVAKEPGVQLGYRLTDFNGNDILSGKAPLAAGPDSTVRAVIAIDRQAAQAVYLRGRLKASLLLEDAAGKPLYSGLREMDHLSFAKRDETPLPALPETVEATPYGELKLVDEIDCSMSLFDDPHPYLQSSFDHSQDRMTPGGPVEVKVVEILGRKARESEIGWFAYRVGRGKLKPHTTYLLRIEYPEDKPRYCPVEIQTGQNYMDVGWKNGVAPDDVYDNWPLSNQWQWYDVIVPLDDETVGAGGTGSAPAENGFWVYFMNKVFPHKYYAMYSAGPAVARIKLYEIDPEKHAPAIQKPQGLPQRVLMFDWERQADHEPADLVKYAKLMGYSAISPLILKWATANYAEPLDGYVSVNIDARNYWVRRFYDAAKGEHAEPAVPGKESVHVRYLAATKRLGLDYIPRFEWGGSQDLPKEACAIDVNGQPTKPNRFHTWCGNLLNPLTWDDLKKLMDHLVQPYAKDNPQLAGVLWRIRSSRMPISYGPADLQLFAQETSTPLPPGGEAQWAAWAAGVMKAKYDDWWHRKRAQFHARLVELLRGYRPDLSLYYFNWDSDKFGLIEPDITAWAFVKNVVKPAPEGGRAAYEKERQVRKDFTAEDYIHVMRTGNFGHAFGDLNRADLGIRPELYKEIPGIRIFAPANYLCYADKPKYLNYFRTADGLAMSNPVSYDEIGSRAINPKYEGNMITPAGATFSMALELLAYFHGDARTITYTVYTYGRGFADAHRRFAQAFLALPAIPGDVVDQPEPDLKVRLYPSDKGTYVGVAHKGYAGKTLTVRIPGRWKKGATVTDLVANKIIPAAQTDDALEFELHTGPMALHAYRIDPPR